MEVAGIDGFLDNVYQLRDVPDTGSVAWGLFTEQWRRKYKGDPVTAADLYSVSDDLDLGEGLERSRRTRMEKALSKMRDRVFDGYAIRTTGTYQGAQRWKLEPLQSGEHRLRLVKFG